MTEVRFYHLQKQSLDQALPLILEKAYGAGHKSVVKMENNAEVERMVKHLWAYKDSAFLPHGSSKDGNAEERMAVGRKKRKISAFFFFILFLFLGFGHNVRYGFYSFFDCFALYLMPHRSNFLRH